MVLSRLLAFDESLAVRIRDALPRKRGVEEKKMFGGVGFLLDGNLLVSEWKDSLCVRFDLDQAKGSATPALQTAPLMPLNGSEPW